MYGSISYIPWLISKKIILLKSSFSNHPSQNPLQTMSKRNQHSDQEPDQGAYRAKFYKVLPPSAPSDPASLPLAPSGPASLPLAPSDPASLPLAPSGPVSTPLNPVQNEQELIHELLALSWSLAVQNPSSDGFNSVLERFNMSREDDLPQGNLLSILLKMLQLYRTCAWEDIRPTFADHGKQICEILRQKILSNPRFEEQVYTSYAWELCGLFYASIELYEDAVTYYAEGMNRLEQKKEMSNSRRAFNVNCITAESLLRKKDFKKAIEHAERALRICSSEGFDTKMPDDNDPVSSKSSPPLAIIHQILGNIYSRMGDVQSRINPKDLTLEHYTLALAALDEKTHPSMCADLENNLGCCYKDMENPKEALKHLQICWLFRNQDSQKNPTDNKRWAKLADVLNNMGLANAKQKDTLSIAKENHQEALAIRRKIFGNCHSDVAASLSNLSEVLCLTGETSEGLKMMEESLAISITILGDNNVFVANVMFNLAMIHNSVKEYAKAQEYYTRCLKVFESHKASDREASTRYYLGRVYFRQRCYALALQHLGISLSMREYLGNDHPKVQAVKNSLSEVNREFLCSR